MNAWGSGHIKTCSIHHHGTTFNKNWYADLKKSKITCLSHFRVVTNKYGGIEISVAMTTSVFNPFKSENHS